MVETEGEQVVQVEVAQVRISLLRYTTSCFPGPAEGFQGSTDSCGGEEHFELVLQEHHHLIEVLVRLLEEVLTQSINHWWSHSRRRSRAVAGCSSASEAAQVCMDRPDGAIATSSHVSHLDGSKPPAVDHVPNQTILRGCEIEYHDRTYFGTQLNVCLYSCIM